MGAIEDRTRARIVSGSLRTLGRAAVTPPALRSRSTAARNRAVTASMYGPIGQL